MIKDQTVSTETLTEKRKKWKKKLDFRPVLSMIMHNYERTASLICKNSFVSISLERLAIQLQGSKWTDCPWAMANHQLVKNKNLF